MVWPWLKSKNGDLGELGKGIFQAIKYRALMEAKKGDGQPYPVAAYLVAYEMSADIEEIAARFDITCVQVSRDQMV